MSRKPRPSPSLRVVPPDITTLPETGYPEVVVHIELGGWGAADAVLGYGRSWPQFVGFWGYERQWTRTPRERPSHPVQLVPLRIETDSCRFPAAAIIMRGGVVC